MLSRRRFFFYTNGSTSSSQCSFRDALAKAAQESDNCHEVDIYRRIFLCVLKAHVD